MIKSFSIDYIKKSVPFIVLYCRDFVYNSKRIIELQNRRNRLELLPQNKKAQRIIKKITKLLVVKIEKQDRWMSELTAIGFIVANMDSGIIHARTYDSIGEDPVTICINQNTKSDKLYYHQIFEPCSSRRLYWK